MSLMLTDQQVKEKKLVTIEILFAELVERDEKHNEEIKKLMSIINNSLQSLEKVNNQVGDIAKNNVTNDGEIVALQAQMSEAITSLTKVTTAKENVTKTDINRIISEIITAMNSGEIIASLNSINDKIDDNINLDKEWGFTINRDPMGKMVTVHAKTIK